MGYWDKRSATTIKDAERDDDAEADSLEKMEQDTIAELSTVENSFRERMKAENKRFLDMCDTEYWFCVCFTSRAQKEEFLRKIGIDTDLKYIDGKDMARAYRKAIKTPDLEFAKVQAFGKEYVDLAMGSENDVRQQ